MWRTGYIPSCPSYPAPQHVSQVCERGPGVQFQETNSSITVNYLLTSATFNSVMDSVLVFNIMVGEAGSLSESWISMTSESASQGLFSGMVTLASVRFFWCVVAFGWHIFSAGIIWDFNNGGGWLGRMSLGDFWAQRQVSIRVSRANVTVECYMWEER